MTEAQSGNLEWTLSMLKSWNNYTPTGFGQLIENSFTSKELTFEIPTSTPIPTLSPEQREAGYVLYDDELRGGWSMDPWGGRADLNSSELVYQGEQSIKVSLETGGAITLDTSSPPAVKENTWLAFYINGGDTADQ